MRHETPTIADYRVGRRACLRLLGAAAGGAYLLRLPGCAYYEAEDGAAFSPWDFPGPRAGPEVIAARAALLAASPHNTQPWALRMTPESIELFADFDRHLGAMDGLRRELHIGLGCALENLAIAARASGRSSQIALLPEASQPNLVARVALQPAEPEHDALFGAIARRHTNRGLYMDRPLPPALERAILPLSAAGGPGIGLHWLPTRSQRARFRRETIAATRAIVADAEMSTASERWYRHSHQEIEQHRDGITLDATGSGALTRFFGKSLWRPSQEVANRYWLAATAERQTTGSAFGILASSDANTRADQLRAGRVYQRMHLWATTQGLAMQPLNQLAERQDREEARMLAPHFTRILGELIATPGRRVQMLFRIGYAVDHAFASPRRPLAWVVR
jgi:hypothetical protein